jgi:hypothetical protein
LNLVAVPFLRDPGYGPVQYYLSALAGENPYP